MRNVFKKGDIITGVSDEFYSWTTDEMTKGIVIETYERDEEMQVEILEHKTNKSQIGHRYTVDNNDEKFRLIKTNFQKDLIEDLSIVTLSNGERLIYVESEQRFFDLNDMHTNSLYDIDDLDDDGDCDGDKIVKIENPTMATVYDRSDDVREMTVAEISKALGYEVKIVKEK